MTLRPFKNNNDSPSKLVIYIPVKLWRAAGDFPLFGSPSLVSLIQRLLSPLPTFPTFHITRTLRNEDHVKNRNRKTHKTGGRNLSLAIV